jgi:hypothetical protein
MRIIEIAMLAVMVVGPVALGIFLKELVRLELQNTGVQHEQERL